MTVLARPVNPVGPVPAARTEQGHEHDGEAGEAGEELGNEQRLAAAPLDERDATQHHAGHLQHTREEAVEEDIAGHMAHVLHQAVEDEPTGRPVGVHYERAAPHGWRAEERS